MLFFNTGSLCIADMSFLGAGPSTGAKLRDGVAIQAWRLDYGHYDVEQCYQGRLRIHIHLQP